MNRGSVEQRARRGDRRIEPLGVADGERRRRRRAAAAIISSASASDRAIGFSTSTGTPAVEKRQRDARGAARSAPRWSPRRPARAARGVEQRAACRCAAAISSARAPVGVDDRDQLDAGQRRQNPRVMLAEMADADDRDAQAHASAATKTRRHEADVRTFRVSCFVSSWHVVTASPLGRRSQIPASSAALDDRVAVDHQRLPGVHRQHASRRRPSSPRSSRRRRPARRTACPASASPP